MSYDKKYFNWQKNIGYFGGIANKFKFEKHIKKNDIVLDFGSGGGYLLKNINCKDKIGIEINESARKEAQLNEVKSIESIDKIKNEFADVIISNHALEHVECPLNILKKLKNKLKKKGKIIFVVPHQSPKEKYIQNDINQHLYTWNPLTLGNLFKNAGYKNIKVSVIRHKWPPKYIQIYNIFGLKIFHIISKLYAIIKNNYQIKIIAEK
jgi:SAM-dependent methyltransferase